VGLEARYRLDLVQKQKANEENRIRRRAKLYSKAPVSELIKRGWIKTDLSNLDQAEKAVCEFLDR
jgi:HTH-type transcriptional regulator/antitoxin HigA